MTTHSSFLPKKEVFGMNFTLHTEHFLCRKSQSLSTNPALRIEFGRFVTQLEMKRAVS